MKKRTVRLLMIIVVALASTTSCIAAIPIANFIASNTTICTGQCINFTDLSTNNPTGWSWSFQGASVFNSSAQNPSNICFNTAGTYFVSLTVSNASGSNTLYIADYITVYPTSVVNLLSNGNFNNYNSGFTSQLTYVATGVLAPDQYSVDTNAIYHNGAWAGISPDSTPFFMCDGSLTSASIVWSENLTNVFRSSAYTFSFLMTNLDVNHTFVQPELQTTVTDQLGTVLFTGTTGLLTPVNSNNPPVFVWTPFNYVFNTLSNTTSITISLSQVGGTYLGFDFALEDMNLKTHFCDSLAALPVAGLFSDENQICPGACADFVSTSSNVTSVQWLFPGGTPAVSTDFNPQHICYNVPGNYDVTIIAANANGSDTLYLQNYVTVLPYPPPQGIIQSGDSLIALQGANSYQWYQSGIQIPGATDYFYIANSSGNFSVIATDSNGCEVEAVINDVVANVDHVISTPELSLSPDPVVDELFIQGDDLRGRVVKISVYNAIGEVVYSTTIKERGSFNCRNLTPGIYFLDLSSPQGNFHSRFLKQ